MNFITAVSHLTNAELVPISIATVLFLARKSLRRIVLSFAIISLVVSLVEFFASLVAAGLSAPAFASSDLFQVTQFVRTILIGVQEYSLFAALVFALYDSIIYHRAIWFIALLLSSIVSFAATQIYEYPALFFARSPITFFIGYFALALEIVYGVFGMRGVRPIQNAGVASPTLTSDTPSSTDASA